MISLFWIFLGGGLGSTCRYAVSRMFNSPLFPFGTLIANILSCLILGVLIGLSSKEILKDHHRLLFMTGFCGGFSTFSAYSADIVQLFQGGQATSAIFYMILSVLTGVLAILVGMFLSQSLVH